MSPYLVIILEEHPEENNVLHIGQQLEKGVSSFQNKELEFNIPFPPTLH